MFLSRKTCLPQRLDEFLGAYMVGNCTYDALWKLCIFVFVLSHRQSNVERGFNVNKDMLIENMETLTLKAMRLTYDELLNSDKDISSFHNTTGLSSSCQKASGWYKKYISDKKKANETDSSDQKRKLLQEECASVKRKKLEEEEVITSLETQISDLISQVAAQKNPKEMMVKIVQADSFKQTVSAKKEVIEELEGSIAKLNVEVKDGSN